MSDIEAIRARDANYARMSSVYAVIGGGRDAEDRHVLLAALAEREAEVERLREALADTCRRYDPDDRLPCWCYQSMPLWENRAHEDRCLAARAALADTPEPTRDGGAA